MTRFSNTQNVGRALSATAVVMSLFVILSSLVFLTITQMSIVPAIKDIKDWMDLTQGQIDFLETGTSVCFALGMIAGGFIPTGTRRPLIIGIALIILSVLVTASGFCRVFESLVAVRFAVGACCGLLMTTLVVLGFDLVSQRFWHTWIAFKSLSLLVGGAIAFILSGLICSKTHGHWQQVFFILGPPGVLLSLIAFFIQEPLCIADSPLSFKVARFIDYFGSNVFLTFIGSAALCVCCVSMLNNGWQKIYFSPASAISANQAIPYIASMSIFFVLTIFVSAIVSDLVRTKNATGPYVIVSICFAACSLSSIFSLVLSNVAFVYLFSFFDYFSLIPLTVLVVSLVRSSHRALIFGLFIGVLMLIGLVLVSLTSHVSANKLFLSGITVVLSLSAIGVYFAGRNHQQVLKEITHVNVKCPECGSTVENIPIQWIGKTVKCDICKCKYILEVQNTV